MRASLRRLHSPDILDLQRYEPEIPNEFGFLLQIFAGPEGEEGEESFDVIVCTPRWLEHKYDQSDVVVGRHHLILFEYDYDRLLRTVEQYCESCEGGSWIEVAEQLSTLGKWEFEDYDE